MTDDSVKRAISITAFAISVVFSAALFSFSLYQVSKQPESALWLSLAVGICNLYMPSPIGLMSIGSGSSSQSQLSISPPPPQVGVLPLSLKPV